MRYFVSNLNADCHTWSAGERHETVNFLANEVKSQGHMWLNIDLKAWQRHHSQPPRSSSSSSLADVLEPSIQDEYYQIRTLQLACGSILHSLAVVC